MLTEGDDQQDPIADAARAILDGHIVLSRQLAESGHYPSIDIEASISRVMQEITKDDHQKNARRFKQMYSLYQQNRDLITVGAYARGSDPRIDEAINMNANLMNFLQQSMGEAVNFTDSVNGLNQLLQRSGKTKG